MYYRNRFHFRRSILNASLSSEQAALPFVVYPLRHQLDELATSGKEFSKRTHVFVRYRPSCRNLVEYPSNSMRCHRVHLVEPRLKHGRFGDNAREIRRV